MKKLIHTFATLTILTGATTAAHLGFEAEFERLRNLRPASKEYGAFFCEEKMNTAMHQLRRLDGSLKNLRDILEYLEDKTQVESKCISGFLDTGSNLFIQESGASGHKKFHHEFFPSFHMGVTNKAKQKISAKDLHSKLGTFLSVIEETLPQSKSHDDRVKRLVVLTNTPGLFHKELEERGGISGNASKRRKK